MDTFLRRLEILNYLRQRHSANLGPVATDQVIQHLIDGEYVDEHERAEASTFRLIQRDLKFLLGGYDEEDEVYTNPFGLEARRGKAKSLLWSLEPYQQVSYDFEKMPAFMALALTITRKHLKQVLPSSTQKELEAVFQNAETKLQKAEGKLSAKHYSKLGNAVEFFQRGQSLSTPDFEMATLDRIYQAILLGKRLKFNYRGAKSSKEYDVHPYGVAIMLPKIYLVAVKDDSVKAGSVEDYRSFLVHRIEDLEVSSLSNAVPDTFELKEYLSDGNMDVLVDNDAKSYTLKISIFANKNSSLIRDLSDSPINSTQELVEVADNEWCLKAQVKRTVQLRTWLLALGAQAKVIEPEIIRQDLIDNLNAMQNHYA